MNVINMLVGLGEAVLLKILVPVWCVVCLVVGAASWPMESVWHRLAAFGRAFQTFYRAKSTVVALKLKAFKLGGKTKPSADAPAPITELLEGA